jgi:hypothetical protein
VEWWGRSTGHPELEIVVLEVQEGSTRRPPRKLPPGVRVWLVPGGARWRRPSRKPRATWT